MKKILLLLLVFPTLVFAQTRDSVYVKNEIFEIVYSEVLQQPKKITYEVQCPNGSASRKGMDFYRVQGVYTSDNLDYEKNEWDKGHMAPAAAFNCNTETLYKTFSYVNCALQQENLNRGAWRFLEAHERELAKTNKVKVVIRVVFDKNCQVLPTGATVPKGFYKYIYVDNKLKFTYYFPNEKPNKTYEHYLVQ